MRFPIEPFTRFCSRLTIDSREQGLVKLKLNGAQTALIGRLDAGLTRGTHHFVCLKARQLGISTLALAFDLFWQFRYPGTQGALVVDKEKTRDQFRSTLEAYIEALPEAWKYAPTSRNRNQLVFPNRSRLAYLVAGGRQSGALARGAGLNFIHASEISSWTDPEGIGSLMASMAEKHPRRFFLFESSARGFNEFYDMWKDAKRARTIEAIFIGWWAKGDYALDPAGTLFKVYWHGTLTGEERGWARNVQKLYGVEITPPQWAWWRWMSHEKIHDKNTALAEFPFFEDQAFVLTGEQFFDLAVLQELYASTAVLPFSGYRYQVGTRFEDTVLYPARDGELTVWAEPVVGAAYVIAADPAYGESDLADHFCIQVLRAWPDKLEQVAEYNTPGMTMYGFAWIIAHLCGAYSSQDCDPLLILELGGPGRGVLQELMRMPAQYSAAVNSLSSQQNAVLANLFGSIQHFLYKRPDTFSSSRLLQWETNHRTKQLMMNLCRDMLERGQLTVRSPGFVEEARYISQLGSRIAGAGRSKDDRVMAMAMGCVAWSEQLQPRLLNAGAVKAVAGANPGVVSRAVSSYLENLMQRSDTDRWEN